VIGLGGVLAASTCVLVPDQSGTALGVELLVVAAAIFASIAAVQRGAWASAVPKGERGATRGAVRLRQVLGLGSALLLATAAVTLLAEGGGGLYWWPAAILAAYTGALTNAWVLMVEILR
jgi:modulator of FtsH protease